MDSSTTGAQLDIRQELGRNFRILQRLASREADSDCENETLLLLVRMVGCVLVNGSSRLQEEDG
jgi:hypothetical protein